MKRLLCLLPLLNAWLAAAPDDVTVLRADRLTEITTTPGLVTTLTFHSHDPLRSPILLGDDILKVTKDPELDRIHIKPKVREGLTNMNLQFGDRVYSVLVHVGPAGAVLTRTYTVEDGATHLPTEEMERLGNAPVLKPFEIPTVQAVDVIERAQVDGTFRAAQEDLRQFPIRRVYIWNGVPVSLLDCYQFLDRDLLVLRIRWENTSKGDTARMLYLHGKQVSLYAAGKSVPVTAMMQKQPNLFPGQADTIYLFVQGLRLYGHQDWSINLPPEAAEVRRMLGGP